MCTKCMLKGKGKGRILIERYLHSKIRVNYRDQPCFKIVLLCILRPSIARVNGSVVTVSKILTVVGFGRFCKKNLGFWFGFGSHN